MKNVKGVLFFLTLMVSVTFVKPVFAILHVHPINNEYAIVADPLIWYCFEVTPYADDGLYYFKYIRGRSSKLNTSFSFFQHLIDWGGSTEYKINIAYDSVKKFLSAYAKKYSTVFSGLTIKRNENDDVFIVTGSFFDNTSLGRFAFYIKTEKKVHVKFNNYSYCMFIKTTNELNDEQSYENLFQDVHGLISPLIIE